MKKISLRNILRVNSRITIFPLTMFLLFLCISIHAIDVHLQNWQSTNAGEPSSTSSYTYKFTTSSSGSTISFDWSVSSEDGYDFLTITLDGTEILKESGIKSSSYSKDFNDNNEHILVCTYSKDGSVDGGDDCASVSNAIAINVDYSVSVTTIEAGTLETLLSTKTPQAIKSLTISGPLDAKDLMYIHTLFSSRWSDNSCEIYNLETLNLSNARFVNSTYQFTINSSLYNFSVSEDRCFEEIRIEGSIDRYFQDNKSLRNLILPSNIKCINDNCFYGGKMLENITLPESLEEIDSYAFSGCGLKSIYIPKKVKKIGLGIFMDCKSLERIDIDTQNEKFNGWLNFAGANAIIGYDGKLYAGCKNTDFHTSNSYHKIGHAAFYGCEGLTEVDIPSCVEIIDGSAFSGCKNLKSVTFHEGLKSVNIQAFYGCEQITEISFPNSLDSLGNGSFAHCNLKKIFLPKSLKWYGRPLKSTLRAENAKSLFWDHSRNYYEYRSPFFGNPIEKISIDKENSYFQSFDDACIAEKATLSLIDGFGTFTIPDIVKRLADRALYNYSSSEIVVPSSVTSIVRNNFDDYFGGQKIQKIYILSENVPTLERTESEKIWDMDFSYQGENDIFVHAWVLPKYKEDPLWSKNKLHPIENMYYLTDGVSYDENKNDSYELLSYTRTFGNTSWQSLYIPFSMTYDDWKEDFEVAYINGIRQMDTDDDGAIDETIMDVVKIKSGSLIPNTPYLIKAKSTGNKTITVNNATLYKAESNSVDCSTTIAKYTFTGTYSTIPAATLLANNYYAMGGGSLIMTDGTSDLKPFRWYLNVESRSPMYNVSSGAKTITINVVGEEEATGISQMSSDREHSSAIYDLNGRKMSQKKLKSGLYIKNGKKIIIK